MHADKSGYIRPQYTLYSGLSPRPEDGYIRLMTHNRQVDYINATEMAKLDSHPFTFEAAVTGTFPEESYPTANSLTLKRAPR